MDTIFAVSSGVPPAAIAVLRLSGPGACEAVRSLGGALPEARRAGLRALRDPADGELLDRALVLCFPAPDSATGEDIVELHLHGGRAVVRAVERCLAAIPGLRPADAGEFTRRALLNGRLDLSEAEGLGDLLMAETEAQRRTALRSAEGGVRREVEGWNGELLAVAAQVEALLDHSDEDDVAGGAGSEATLRDAASSLGARLAATLAQPPVERLRDGLRVVLAGPRNAGKSTLLNALAGREAAIVSSLAGTTRDRIEVPIVRDGVAYLLIDTAGLADSTGDAIEAIGISRARDAMQEADILVWLGDDAPPGHPCPIWVHARADEAGREQSGAKDVAISVHSGEGVRAFWDLLSEASRHLLPPPDAVALNGRQRALVGQAEAALRRAAEQSDLLLMAEELRSARRAFDAITGRSGVEAMLDSLFARFCIGK
ncbi:tRNA uridine-5-carboxymethylaminomethyl(34) synthesis GTPase MnmE [Sphingomonas sp. M1-B02]|uniref:tRNA uridine-5-carboxymethylaminomethyl(34) synthesis GTPase MnmE n=1 Tax=Sphingomonas sp. M1-B02 TaxID=3114300 RepID=UPI00223EEA1F|nr:tRNA uridine-5-carboxymethylaminomethyl(34) synthesis GTPase MnmE [Sphingomonas sp. S6-11]UZK65224.1 tRNA uridine-5-carboxymethylaminomethyl(34) synthesis GTPase MnmE [Sphingomonas sp. S6-11]